MKSLVLSFLFLLGCKMKSQDISIANIFHCKCSDSITLSNYNIIKSIYQFNLEKNKKYLTVVDSGMEGYKYYSSNIKKNDSVVVYEKTKQNDDVMFFKNQFHINYDDYIIYGASEDSLGIKVSNLSIYLENKLVENINYSLNTVIVKIPKERYVRTDIYDLKTKSCLSSYIQDSYFSDVFVKKSYTYNSGKEEVTDWDKLFSISDKELLKILPLRFSQGIKLQLKKIEGTTFADEKIKDAKIFYLKKNNTNFKSAIIQFMSSNFKQNNGIRFEKIIHENIGYWIIYYNSYVLGLKGDGEFYNFEEKVIED